MLLAMDYAIVQTGGKQYRVRPGDSITVEKLPGEEGDAVELNDVLLVSKDAQVSVGQPSVAGAKVLAQVARQGKAKKITVLKYKPKTRHHVQSGHRQQVTQLDVKEIVAG